MRKAINSSIIALLIFNTLFSVYQLVVYNYDLNTSIDNLFWSKKMPRTYIRRGNCELEKWNTAWLTSKGINEEAKKLWSIKLTLDGLILVSVAYWMAVRKRETTTST